MRPLFIVFLLGFVNLFSAGTPPNDTAPQPQDSIAALVRSIDSIAKAEMNWIRSRPESKLGNQSYSMLEDMRKKLQPVPAMLLEKKELAPLYTTELENYLQLLLRIRQEKEEVQKWDLIQFIHADLTDKYWFPGPGINPSNPLTTVRVKFRVLDEKGETELSGYIGYIKPQLSNLPHNVTSFIPTTTTVKDVVPGVKLAWIEKDGKVVQSKVESIRRNLGTRELPFLIKQ